ncbi:unnamed protein product [Rotaria sordida]|uniref:Uncharacterized protein n=1 Tax=Rotaria sordida TaxID=392033 RepID=A0A814IUD8_9BILA|nr:unnamed protein product [Rotaria sordida]CAF1159243.1 unnamed protein product [Rotaria sordida]
MSHNESQIKDEFFQDVEKYPYKTVSHALQIILRTLIQNYGIDGETDQLVDMHKFGVYEPIAVKMQSIKTAFETTVLLLRIDDIVPYAKKASMLAE